LNTRGKEKVKVYNRAVWQGSSLSNNLPRPECISTEGEKVSACRFTQHHYPCSQPTLFLSRLCWERSRLINILLLILKNCIRIEIRVVHNLTVAEYEDSV